MDRKVGLTGIVKAVWFDEKGLPDIGPTPGAGYDPERLWWFHENCFYRRYRKKQNGRVL